MIRFLTILDSDNFNTSSLSSSVRKWMARMRPRCLLLFTLSTSVAVVTRWCLLVRWEARAFVSPCTREIGLWQRMQGTRETTIFDVYFSLTGGYKENPSDFDVFSGFLPLTFGDEIYCK